MSKAKMFSQNDVSNIWGFLIGHSFANIAKRYQCGIATIRHIPEGITYKRETRLVDPDLVARAEKAIKGRQKRSPQSDVSYLDEVAF